jgi:trk system potassium uptake protein TrkA
MLDNPSLMDTLSIADGYSIVEIAPPKSFIAKSPNELDLRSCFNVQGMMVQEVASEQIHPIPDGSFVIKDSDHLFVTGRD